MAASEFVVTKAGPNTIMEAFATGIPVLITHFVPGQEEGNVRFVVENGAGAYADRPDEIAAIASSWLREARPDLTRMAQMARRLGRPAAAQEIAADIPSHALPRAREGHDHREGG
jgi:1,2-diacylglycerol 3-beta-galactosyltransferase